jgi:fructose-1,6-bisphosphatase II
MRDKEREIMLDVVRVTEAAALMAGRVMGNGNKELVDALAVDAMRGMLELMDIRGEVIIGEGEKDQAPMLYIGEKVGREDCDFEADIAVDPIEGTTLVAKGLPNALSVMVLAAKGALKPVPSYYMEKIIAGPGVGEYLDIEAPVRENLRVAAAALGKNVRDLTVVILDRPRHQQLIKEARETGARIKLISDGDVAAGIATCLPDTGVDILMGIGGSPEGVLAAVAVKCLGGTILARIAPKDEEEKRRLIEKIGEKKLRRVYTTEDLAGGDSLIFAATGVTDGDLLRGVRYYGNYATTSSIVMRMQTGTVRRIETTHNLNRKTIRSKQQAAEIPV